MPRIARKASHAGTWYEGDDKSLGNQIDRWIQQAKLTANAPARAVIAPHAGYRYCGHVMAYAYGQIDASTVARVFVLGPSHHMYTKKCLLSSATHYETPLGSVEIDQDVYAELRATGRFDTMSLDVDEAEHSLELHMPYIMRVMGKQRYKLVPIMVGALNPDSEALYGKLLIRYLEDPSNVFVISSDFCHWGTRFSYTYYDESKGPIYKSIEWLDKLGMDIIEEGNPHKFTQYLKQYSNTICGRHPIGVFLNALHLSSRQHSICFTRYDQSSPCLNFRDSSVSYAAAVVTAQ